MSHLWFPATQDTLSQGAKPGHWQDHSPKALRELASKLSFDGITTRINSLPTPWARVAQMEEAIKDPHYPTRDELLGELLGCLAVVGLSNVYHVDLQGKILDLKECCDDRKQPEAVKRFATSLWENKPEARRSVLKGASPWDRLLILMVDDDKTRQSQPIGFGSPSSILCPTAQLLWRIESMPWSYKGKFSDPIPHLSLEHKQPLANWLRQLASNILSSTPVNPILANNLCGVLEEFIDRLEVQPSTGTDKGKPIPNASNIMDGLLAHSAAPVKSDKNLCRVILTDKKEKNPNPVILVDPSMPRQLQKAESEIQLYGTDTLATICGDAERLREHYKDINVVTPDDLFLPTLTLLPGGHALRHSWLPEKLTARLEVGDVGDTTPLLPFSVHLQELFSSRELNEKVSLAMDHGQGCLVVGLMLPLEGFGEYRLERSYPLKEATLLGRIPVMAIWPSIPDGYWHKYWIVSEMVDGLSINKTEAWEDPHLLEFDSDQVRYFCSTSFPDLLNVSVDQRPGGLLPLDSPDPIKGTVDRWDVGLDFGTSFTNWAICDHNQGPCIRSLESVLWPVTEASDELQQGFLNRYFLPQTMEPAPDNPPTSTSLSVVGGGNKVNSDYKKVPELFHEARLHVPQNGDEFKAHLRTGFKWENPELQRPFLRQLALMISANAVRSGANKVTWRLSYPTAFPPKTKENYQNLWGKLTEELRGISRLEQELDKSPLLSEAVAFARCLADSGLHDSDLDNRRKEAIFQYTACMDIGGHTTDISLWQKDKLIHQVSVPFAGQHICTKILNCRPEFASNLLEDIRLTSITQGSNSKMMELNRLNLIDNSIRFRSEKLLKDDMNIRRSQGKKDKKLEQFISLMALATGGLYHYLGFIVRCLYEKERLSRGSCMSVYVGGNGGNLLHWLAPTGQFHSDSPVSTWLNRIQSSAIGLNNDKSEEKTYLSGKFKDEVAIGLVVDHHKHISDPDDLASNPPPPFSGESLRINQREFTAEDPIDLSDRQFFEHSDTVDTMELLNLKELQRYVRGTVKAMDGIQADLQIDPLVKESDLEGALGTRVLDKAQDLCNQSLGDPQDPKKIGSNFSVRPGFFLGLQALIEVLAEDWAADRL